jgi:hypothetical protein
MLAAKVDQAYAHLSVLAMPDSFHATAEFLTGVSNKKTLHRRSDTGKKDRLRARRDSKPVTF